MLNFFKNLSFLLVLGFSFFPNLWATSYDLSPSDLYGEGSSSLAKSSQGELMMSSDQLIGAKSGRSKRVSPSTALSIPTGFGAGFLDFFVGGLVNHRGRGNGDNADAVGIVGLGLGNPQKYVGVDVAATISDLGGDLAGDGSFSLKVHRRIPWGLSSLSAGVNSFAWWGRNTNVPSYSLVFSRKFLRRAPYFNSLTFHIGAGTGYYVSEDHQIELISKKRKGENAHDFSEWGVIGGAALGIFPFMNAVSNWNGQNLDAGLSFAPFQKHRFIINFLVRDLLDTAGSGKIWSVSAYYSFNLLRTFRDRSSL